jgi:hypothetical protein
MQRHQERGASLYAGVDRVPISSCRAEYGQAMIPIESISSISSVISGDIYPARNVIWDTWTRRLQSVVKIRYIPGLTYITTTGLVGGVR